METVRIEIELESAAFHPNPLQELARILRDAADKIEGGNMPPDGDFGLRDRNGVPVGCVEWGGP